MPSDLLRICRQLDPFHIYVSNIWYSRRQSSWKEPVLGLCSLPGYDSQRFWWWLVHCTLLRWPLSIFRYIWYTWHLVHYIRVVSVSASYSRDAGFKSRLETSYPYWYSVGFLSPETNIITIFQIQAWALFTYHFHIFTNHFTLQNSLSYWQRH
jgi:hypothetical protein